MFDSKRDWLYPLELHQGGCHWGQQISLSEIIYIVWKKAIRMKMAKRMCHAVESWCSYLDLWLARFERDKFVDPDWIFFLIAGIKECCWWSLTSSNCFCWETISWWNSLSSVWWERIIIDSDSGDIRGRIVSVIAIKNLRMSEFFLITSFVLFAEYASNII